MQRLSLCLVPIIPAALIHRDYRRNNSTDTVVVGQGITGLSATYHLAKLGQRVVNVSKGRADGSSMSGERICALSGYSGPNDAENLDLADKIWNQIEHESNRTIVQRGPGVVMVAKAGTSRDTMFRTAAENHPERLTVIPTETARDQFPMFKFKEDDVVYHDKKGGFIHSDEAIAGLVDASQRLGAQLKVGQEVTTYRLINTIWGKRVRVEYRSGESQSTIIAKHVILAGGKERRNDIIDLGGNLDVMLQTVGYIEPTENQVLAFHGMPAYTWEIPEGIVYYGFPPSHFDTMRIGAYRSCPRPIISGEHVDRFSVKLTDDGQGHDAIDFEQAERVFRHFADTRIRTTSTLDSGTAGVCRTTFLTNSKGDRYGHPIIGAIPNSDGRIVIFAGCMGKGFKFGPVHGQFIANYVFNGELPESGSHFSMDRYLKWLNTEKE